MSKLKESPTYKQYAKLNEEIISVLQTLSKMIRLNKYNSAVISAQRTKIEGTITALKAFIKTVDGDMKSASVRALESAENALKEVQWCNKQLV